MSSALSLLEHFAQVPDPRLERTQLHSLQSILLIAICGVICGAGNWAAIERFGHAKQDFFTKIIDLPNGIPSHDTFGRVFAALNTESFNEAFIAWVQCLTKALGTDIVAIDGKTMRRTRNAAKGEPAIHLVSAFAHANGVALGQVAVDSKSNEITAIPALLQKLVLSGCLVTLDAMGCQKVIAANIVDAGADYLLSLKGNHGTAFDEVQQYFAHADATAFTDIAHGHHEDIDAGHGRVECRRVDTVPMDWFPERMLWRGLQSAVRVQSERHIGNETSHETRYFLSTLPVAEAQRAAEGVRGHWAIENQLHWCLDVAFNEDQQRMRTGDAAANMALLSKLALNLLKRETSRKVGIKIRRLEAGWNDAYLLKVLAAGGGGN